MNISWDDHRYFLAIARAGSLTAAARSLAVSQPTVSRRLAAMEAALGVRLFHRTRKGYELTASGGELFKTVVRVEEDLTEADRSIFGRDREISGSLRFTSTEIFINGYLGPAIWEFLRQHPGIEIQIICTQSLLSLSRGEADVAVRFIENPLETLAGRRLATVAYGVYAAAGPLGQRFLTAGQSSWDWIGMHNETFNRMIFGTFSPSTRLKHQADSMAAMHAMVRAGLGVSILPCYTADRDPALTRLSPQPLLDRRFGMWVLHHPEARRAHRLRLFADHIASHIGADVDLFEGRRPGNLPV